MDTKSETKRNIEGTRNNIALSKLGVYSVSLVLFFYIIFGEEKFGIIIRIIISGAYTLMAIIFLRNMEVNEEQRDELSALNKEIEKTNGILQGKVKERTKEIESARIHIETIIDNLSSGILEYDNSGILKRINRSAEKMLSVSHEDVLGKKISEDDDTRISTVSYPLIARNIIKIDPKLYDIETPEAEIHEITFLERKEDVLQVTSVPIMVSGKKDGVIKIIRDITKEKSASKSKSVFITTAAHQLRTPLSIIKWAVNILLEGDKGAISPDQQSELDKVNVINERMITLVNNLLDVARIEEGRYGFKFLEGNIVSVIENIVTRIMPIAQKKAISLSWQTPFPPIQNTFFDEEKITLAISNIINNAITYTGEKGTITVSAENEEDFVKILIEDSGVGIPPEEQEHLFEKFFRADNALKIRPDGSGLGLFVSYNIVKRHGGDLKIISPILDDLGTRVEIYLPKDKEKIPRLEEGEFSP